MTAKPRYVIALDQGTTNTKAVVLDHQGRIIQRRSRPVGIQFPRPGWVEQDAYDLWATAKAVLRECFESCPANSVGAIGIANQRESILLWQRSNGVPVSQCISWQCLRSTELCERLKKTDLNDTFVSKTGLRIGPLFSGSKLAWLLESDHEIRARAESNELCAGTVDSWLLWNLTQGRVHATDASNASRTQMLNIRSAQWDSNLLSAFGIPRCLLPTVHPSNAFFGETCRADDIPSGIPICGVLGDSHAALFAHAAFKPGMVKATYGTGSSLMTPTLQPGSDPRVSSTVAWALGAEPQYALEGNIPATGAAVQWVGQFLGLKDPVRDTGALAAEVADSEGVLFVPALAGLGAPHWDEKARGVISGLTRASSAAHLARATLDSIGFQVRDLLEAMEEAAGVQMPILLADGGATENQLLMQIQADILGRPVVCSASRDLSAQGAAWMAGLASGFWESLAELESIPQNTIRYDPQTEPAQRKAKHQEWREAVARASTARDSVHD